MATEPSLTADDWFEYPHGELLHANGKTLPGAMAASLVLHAGVFLAVMSMTFRPGLQPVSVPEIKEQGIAITIVRRDDSLVEETSEQPEPGITDIAPVVTTGETDRQPAVTRVSESPAVDPAPAQDETGITPFQEQAAELDRASTLALVNTSIASFREVLQTDLNREYVGDCIRYRNRYGPASECPESFGESMEGRQEEKAAVAELFAAVTRDADHARMVRTLERKEDYLRIVMKESGELGKQAAIRWQLNRQNQAYLSGNVLPDLTLARQTTFVNDFHKLPSPGPIQFRCKQWPLPCVYKYTGFTAKRPENYVEGDSPFVFIPPLFKPSKD
jgi:hypothetical protein